MVATTLTSHHSHARTPAHQNRRRDPTPPARPANFRALLAANVGADFVWPNRDGGPMRGNLMYRRHFLPAAERAGLQVDGLPRVRFHDLRHTYAALLIALNAPPKAIQMWMGHSSISVTFDVYGHLFPFAEDEVTSRLDALMSG